MFSLYKPKWLSIGLPSHTGYCEGKRNPLIMSREFVLWERQEEEVSHRSWNSSSRCESPCKRVMFLSFFLSFLLWVYITIYRLAIEVERATWSGCLFPHMLLILNLAGAPTVLFFSWLSLVFLYPWDLLSSHTLTSATILSEAWLKSRISSSLSSFPPSSPPLLSFLSQIMSR